MLALFKKKTTITSDLQAPPTMSNQEKELERQAKIASMQKNLDEINQKVEILYEKIEKKEASIKDLIRMKKKTEAKKQLPILKTLQNEVQKLENMSIIYEKTKIQIEAASDLSKITNTFKEAATLMKENESNREFLEDFLMDKRELDQQNAEIGLLLKEIASGTQEEVEEIDKMFADMENEVLEEKKVLESNISSSMSKDVANQSRSTNATNETMKEDTVEELLLAMSAN